MKLELYLILAAATIVGASGADKGVPPGSKEAFLKLCTACHRPETVVSGRRTRSQWEDTVEKMIAKGAKGSDDEFLLTLDYLMAEHGRVNVNNATSYEMVEVLGITQEEAESIVKYRRANGRFEDFEALGKVPQVDTKKLEQSRDAISF